MTSPKRNENVPATSEEQAKDALECVAAGATVIPTHTPNIAVSPAETADQYAVGFRPVVEAYPGVICYPTTGIGPTIEDRYGHVELLDDMGLVRAGFVDIAYKRTPAGRAGSVRASRSSNPGFSAGGYLGGSLLDTPIALAALERGGHLRIGPEDCDEGPSNVEQTTAAAQLCRSMGRAVAGVVDAARVLGLPG